MAAAAEEAAAAEAAEAVSEMSNGMAEEKTKVSAEVFTLQWHITHRCNLRCTHCYQDDYACSAGLDSLLPVLDKYERFLKERGYLGKINLTGGEPLTSAAFFPLCREIQSRGISFNILTNGTLIDEENARKIAAVCPGWVQISLDGTERTHDRIRGEGAFSAALRGIDELKMRNVPVLVSFTAQKRNRRQLPALAEICDEHGVDLLWWDRVVTGSGSSARKLALTTKQFRKLTEVSGELSRKYIKSNGRSMVGCGRALQFLECPGSPGYVCSAGKNLVAVTADGSVMPCRRLPYVIGSIADRELGDILDSSPVIQSIRSAEIPAECAGCEHAGKCGGGSKCVTCGLTGDMFARDINCYYNPLQR